MSALQITEENLDLNNNPPANLLAEKLLEFANEAYVFNGPAQPRPAPKTEAGPKRFPGPTRAYFSDVAPPPLAPHHLQNARVVAGREEILPLLPKGGICAEIGTRTGEFGSQILSTLKPARLHLCDRDFDMFDDTPFLTAIERGIVELHEGDMAEHLAAQPDGHFNLICIHPGHSYLEAARALEQAGRKIKEDGFILCANYTTFSPLEGIKYGVVRAVNEFCHTNCFELTCLALDALGHQHVALRKCPGQSGTGHLGGAFLAAPDTYTFLPDVWDYLVEKYNIQSVLDVGSGAGWSTKWFSDRGIYTLGVEGWPEALAKSQCRANTLEHDYSSGPFVPSVILDLAWCAGFVEQIEEQYIPHFMASFRSCRFVCLTHAEPGDQGYHYVNCQPTDYWVKVMNDFGFDFDEAETAHLRLTDKHKAPRGRRTLTFFKRRRQNP